MEVLAVLKFLQIFAEIFAQSKGDKDEEHHGDKFDKLGEGEEEFEKYPSSITLKKITKKAQKSISCLKNVV